jgi:hypothetical protein
MASSADRAGIDQGLHGFPREQAVGSRKGTPKNLERGQRDNDRFAGIG